MHIQHEIDNSAAKVSRHLQKRIHLRRRHRRLRCFLLRRVTWRLRCCWFGSRRRRAAIPGAAQLMFCSRRGGRRTAVAQLQSSELLGCAIGRACIITA